MVAFGCERKYFCAAVMSCLVGLGVMAFVGLYEMQYGCPSFGWNFPSGHDRQECDLLSKYESMWHKYQQASATGEVNWPSGQTTQEVISVCLANVPRWQLSQVLLF